MAEEIPQDLIMSEIALNLPVKSIGRFKSVSKPCNIFFSSPEFVKSHLHHHTRHTPERIILIDFYGLTPHVVTLTPDGGGGSSREVRSQIFNGNDTVLQGCCNGLVLLAVGIFVGNVSLVLINPVTLRATEVPVSFTRAKGRNVLNEMIFGLGYSTVDDDYKIVVLWDLLNDPEPQKVNIFSLKTRSWKKLANSPYLPSEYCPGVYADGRLHWLAHKGKGDTLVIAAFDLSTEKFGEKPFPYGYECDQLKYPRFSLAGLGECLALLDYNMGFSGVKKPIDVWIREKSGERVCWRNFAIANYPLNPEKNQIHCNSELICRLGEFEFVLSKNQEELVAYNWEHRVWRVMDIAGLPKVFVHGSILTFRESLVCPNFQL